MTWARFDDGMGDHRKVRRALRGAGLGTLGLHALAILHSARYLTDGFVEREFVDETFDVARTKSRERTQIVQQLERHGLWEAVGDEGWQIHDYLEHNPSRAEVEDKRRRDSERKARGRRAQSDRSPRGHQPESDGPVPSRPVPTQEPPNPPTGGDDLGWKEWLEHHCSVTGFDPPAERTKAYKAMVALFRQRRQEGYELDDLKLATVGAWNDEHRREHGYTTPDSILRPTKVHGLIDKGKRVGSKPALTVVAAQNAGQAGGHPCRQCHERPAAPNSGGLCEPCVEALVA